MGAEPARLLFTEGRPGLLTALAVFLSSLCSVELAPAVAEALDRAIEWHPDVMVIDLTTPALEDVCLIRALADRLAGSRLVIVADRVDAALQELRGLPLDGLLLKPLSVERLLGRIRHALSLPAVRISRYTGTTIGYVGRHFAERITLRTVAKLGSASTNHLATKFRRETGMTAKQYVTAVRIEAAKHLLVTTDAKLMAIARQTGFCDDSHLCRAFQARVGVSPGHYRAQHAGQVRALLNTRERNVLGTWRTAGPVRPA